MSQANTTAAAVLGLGVGTLIGSGFWYAYRISERRKLALALSQDSRIRLLQTISTIVKPDEKLKLDDLAAGLFDKEAANQIRLTNAINADDALAETLKRVQKYMDGLPEEALDGLKSILGISDKTVRQVRQALNFFLGRGSLDGSKDRPGTDSKSNPQLTYQERHPVSHSPRLAANTTGRM